MKQPNFFIKLVTTSCSLLLVAGCISYHAGAFKEILGTGGQPDGSSNSPGLEKNLTGDSKPGGFPPARAATTQSQPENAKPEPTVFNGTKAPIRNSTFNLSTPQFGGYQP